MKTNNEMIAEIISSVEYHCKKTKRNKKVITTFIAVISILVCLGTCVGAAIHSYPVFSRGWADQMKENAALASGQEAAEEFRKRLSQTDDIFSENAAKNSFEVIMNYDNSIPLNLIQENNGLTYNFTMITEGEFLNLSLTGGSIADSSAEFEYQILNRYYAIIEISRTDNAPLKEENLIPYNIMYFIPGYNPYTVDMCLKSGAVIEYTENKIYCAIDITDMLVFADNDLYLAMADYEKFDIYEHIYANKKGDIILKDNAPENSVLFRFNPGSEFADKKAAKQYLKEHPIINKNFDSYTK